MRISRWAKSKRLWVAAMAMVIAGCLGRPDIQDRWTNLELLRSNIDPMSPPDLAAAPTIQASARITYREILTGFMVAELRASDIILDTMVELNPLQQRIGTARDVDLILENSVTAGRDVRPVTGYPGLMQEIDFEFEAVDTTSLLPMGSTINGLFLVVYMGDGEEVELADGTDSLVVDPFLSSEYDILHQGIAVPLTAPASP